MNGIRKLRTDYTDSKKGKILKRLYQEKLLDVERSLNHIKVGKAEEYLKPVAHYKEDMKARIEVAEILKRYKLDNIEHQFQSEKMAAKQNFENEKQLLMETFTDDIEQKIRRLEKDRGGNNITDEVQSGEVDRVPNNRRRRRRTRRFRHRKIEDSEDSSQPKPVTVSGPYIVYMLKDSDIYEDWETIRKALATCDNSPDSD